MPLVSILVPTYNHEKYIAKCLESLISQKTDFEYEILVGEDDSEDKTREICITYAEKYPEKIKLFLNDRKNVIYINGKPTGRWNLMNLIHHARGKYIAICEGDDQFLDDYKLQKQVEFMEKFPQFSMTFHPVVWWESPKNTVRIYEPIFKKPYYTLDDLLERNNFIAICSAMYRADAIKDLPDWFRQIPYGDLGLHSLAGIKGNFGFINEVMSLYRKHGRGYYSGSNKLDQIYSALKCFDIISENLQLQNRDSARRGMIQLHKQLHTENANVLKSLENGALNNKVEQQVKPESDDIFKIFEMAQNALQNREFSKAQYLMGIYRDNVDYNQIQKLDNRDQKQTPRVSVVIVTYKKGEDLIKCIQSVQNQSVQDDLYEIIVVDNGGNESVHSQLEKLPILWIQSPINLLLSEGRNLGAHFARGEYLAFLDDDALVPGNYIASIIKAFEQYDIVALRGKVLPKDKTPYNEKAGHYDFGEVPFPHTIDTEGNSAFRADVYRKLKGMDPLLFGMEGTDISYLIFHAYKKHVLMYWPETIIYHDYADSQNKFEIKENRHQLMREYLQAKNPEILVWAFNYNAQFAQYSEVLKQIPESLQKQYSEKMTSRYILQQENITSKGEGEAAISVCMPTYNRAEYITEAIDSIFYNKNLPAEIIVLDDGSTDNTEHLLKERYGDKIRYIRQVQSGAPVARNRLVQEAKGNYLLWLDSDDLLCPEIIDRYMAYIENYPDVDVFYGNIYKVDGELNLLDYLIYPDWYKDNNKLIKKMIDINQLPNPGVLIKKSAYDKIGLYNTQFTRAHDYEWFSRAASKLLFKHVGAYTTFYRIHNTNISGDLKNKDLSFEIQIKKNLLAEYDLKELFKSEIELFEALGEGIESVYFHIAKQFLSLNDFEEALKYYRLCYEAKPYPEVKKIISQLEQNITSTRKSSSRKNKNSDVLKMNKIFDSQARDKLPITAIIAAYNEGDVIYHVIKDLVEQDIQVYLIDHHSTDNTVEEASKWLGKGLIKIETFPEESGFDIPPDVYAWRYILLRKEQIAKELGPGWYIHADADEFRESPFEGLSLREGIEKVDREGYNAIDFLLLEFKPTDNSFVPGDDVRKYLIYYDAPRLKMDNVQVKCWKYTGQEFNLWKSGGHSVEFKGKKVYPVPFICRHYPIRSQEHGLKKVFQERKKRFDREEKKARWHAQYDHIQSEEYNFIVDKRNLKKYDREEILNSIRKLFNPAGHRKSQPDSLVSIVMLTYNQLDYTRACIESIYQYTDIPFELIIVDNHSTDGTRKWLKQLQKTKKNVKIILNQKNEGFPKGCNQGIQSARGNYILLLNNDVIVTDGWLRRMVKAFERDPELGIVGPMTNNISGPQKDPQANYSSIEEMHSYAAKVAEINHEQLMYFPRIVGFAMLIKREVIEKIGLLEESFGSGNYEDDDFCLRAELAGYKAAIVKDSFIHHFGSVSFTAEGLKQYVDKLSQNSDKFYEKWKDLDKPSLMWSIFLFNKAKEEKEKGNIDFALELYEKVFQQKPEEKVLIEEYTGLLLETGQTETAMDKLEQYLEKQPEDHEGWNFLGSLYLDSGRIEDSYQAFQKAVKLYNQNLDYFRNLVDVALLLDDFETATTGLEYILARIPGDKEASLKMAHLMMEAGETNKAKEFLSFAMEQNPEDQQLQFYLKKTSSPMLYLTYAFIEGQRYDLAFEAVEQFLNEHPDDVEALSLKASILFYYQQFDEAEKIYGHILEIEPEHPEARYYLMKLYRMVGKNKELKELLNSVQEGIEKDAPYLQEMIMSLIELEEFEQALKHIEAYIGKFPEDYFGYWIMGNLYREMEDTDKALRFYHSALENGIDNPEILADIEEYINRLEAVS